MIYEKGQDLHGFHDRFVMCLHTLSPFMIHVFLNYHSIIKHEKRDVMPSVKYIFKREQKKESTLKSTFSSFAFFAKETIYPAICSGPRISKLAIPSIAILFEGIVVQPPLSSPVRTEWIPLV